MATAQEIDPRTYNPQPMPEPAPPPPPKSTVEAPPPPPPVRREASIHDDVRVPIFGHSAQDFRLPCGYVDEQGVLHSTVTMKQMTGYEEDMMANTKLVVTERITNILASCCTQLGTITDPKVIRAAIADTVSPPCLPLTAADRLAMLLFLRIVSIGEEYRFDSVCPHCEADNKGKALDLPELEIKYVEDPFKRLADVVLPKSKVTVTLKIMTGKGEGEVAKLRPDSKNARAYAMLARVVALNGQPMSGNARKDVEILKQMPSQDSAYLRKIFDIMEGAVDTDVEIQCNACTKWFKFSLDLGQVFFSQTEDTVSPDQIKWK